MSGDLPENCKYAIDEEEESQAEREMDFNSEGYDVDEVYDRIRDDDSECLRESVYELIEKLSKLIYYKNRNEGLAKDIIQNTLEKLKFKIGSVENIAHFQNIELIKKEEVVV